MAENEENKVEMKTKFCKHCGDEDYCSDCHSDHSLFEHYERPTGRWTSEDFDEWYECSNCLKGDTYFDGLPNFCPNCGADMRRDHRVKSNKKNPS